MAFEPLFRLALISHHLSGAPINQRLTYDTISPHIQFHVEALQKMNLLAEVAEFHKAVARRLSMLTHWQDVENATSVGVLGGTWLAIHLEHKHSLLSDSSAIGSARQCQRTPALCASTVTNITR
jgi:hypothetical protein